MTGAIRWTPEQLRDYEARLGRPLKLRTEKADRPKKESKYSNQRVEVGGRVFDSKREAARFHALQRLAAEGVISDLIPQVTFVLAPAVQMEGNARKTPALRYVADFVYVKDGRLVVEDAKGMRTRAYLQKKHLMKSVHGIDILET